MASTTLVSLPPFPSAALPWFSADTGIYRSKHQPVELPTAELLDVVSHVFSHQQKGIAALVDSSSGSSLSYPELRKGVRRLASGVSGTGICRNDVVLVLLPNSVFFPLVCLGVLAAGAIVSPMSPLSSSEEIAKQVRSSGASFAFASSSSAPKLAAVSVRVVQVPDRLEFDPSEFPLFHELLNAEPWQGPGPLIRQTDTAALMYSSGTSGANKGVALTHRNMISMVELFVRFEASQYGRDGWENVYLCAIPMFHVYGLSLFALGLLSLGSTIIVMKKFDGEKAARAIERFNVTHFPAVPPILAALVKAKRALGCDLLSLKQVSSGAAPLSEEHIRRFLSNYPHVDFIQGYGMTETTAVGTRGFNTGYIKKYTSAGLLAPNMEAKVVDWNTGTCLPPGYKGELWLRGPAIMKGYLNEENATLSTIDSDGWLKTGDIAHFDEDAYLYIRDRLKDTIKYKGYQIAPADLEAVLISHPDIVDVAVTGALDDDAGEIPVAFVVRKFGSMLSPAEVISYVDKRVTPYKKVRKVVFVDAIPRSPAGKILRRLLRNGMISKM